MKKKSTSQSAPARRSLGEGGFFNLRVLIASVFCLAGVFIALVGAGIYLGSSKAQAQSGPASTMPVTANSPNGPDVVRLVGPVIVSTDLRDLPYIPPAPQILKRLLKPYQHPENRRPSRSQTSGLVEIESLIKGVLRPVPTMPSPLLTFDGINWEDNRIPPDTNGDVGPNDYVQSVNGVFQVFDKSGNPRTPVTTFNSIFAPLGTSTPCGRNQNQGDPFVFYDQIADRWVITDFAFPEPKPTPTPTPQPEFPGAGGLTPQPEFPGPEDFGPGPFYECIAVSRTGDPVTGGWFLYALQTDPANPDRFGDYPKFGLWPDAYYLTMNEFTSEPPPPNEPPRPISTATPTPTPTATPFFAVRVYALNRASMIAGGPIDAVGFTIPADETGLNGSSSLVPASFRTGNPPPADEKEFLLAVDGTEDVILRQVKGWLFHVDFVMPANSTLGVGANHAPNALITVRGFLNAPGEEVPQPGTVAELDTVGDRMMTPVVYQNRSGTESLWADKTVFLTLYGPTGVRWYQFDVTGGNFPAVAVQQQDWSNGNDGLWRWMPSIAVDAHGNVAIGYSVSSQSIFPGIRYAGRLATDPLNDLGQGEAVMTNGGGSQTGGGGRWGDYTMTTIDPADGLSFWHTNEYYPRTEDHNWFTRVGKFQFPAVGPRPTPTPRPHPTETPRP
jgi:hypothetical protein